MWSGRGSDDGGMCDERLRAERTRKDYGLFQVGVTTGAETAQDPQQPKLAVGADFGHAINRNVEIYLAGGWQEEVPPALRDTYHFTSGIKLMLTRDTFVRPYLLAGAGMMHFRLPEFFDGKNRFLTEVGAGVAFPVGAARVHRHRVPLLQAVPRSDRFHAEWRVRRVRLSLLTPAARISGSDPQV